MVELSIWRCASANMRECVAVEQHWKKGFPSVCRVSDSGRRDEGRTLEFPLSGRERFLFSCCIIEWLRQNLITCSRCDSEKFQRWYRWYSWVCYSWVCDCVWFDEWHLRASILKCPFSIYDSLDVDMRAPQQPQWSDDAILGLGVKRCEHSDYKVHAASRGKWHRQALEEKKKSSCHI